MRDYTTESTTMFLDRFFKGGLIEFTAMSLISLLLDSIYTVEGWSISEMLCFS